MSDSLMEYRQELPLVTIAMPIYNAGQYLRMAVLSMVQQTYQNWELLLIDDGSTDNSLQYIKDIKDPRVQIFQDGVNKGLAARLNECIALARGKYIARMDQDDVSFPERLARQLAMLEGDAALDLVATRALTIDEGNRITGELPYAITHKDICARPWQGFYLPHPTWMGTVSWFRRHRYALPGPYFCEDQELLLRSYRVSRFATIDDVLFAYRIRAAVQPKKLAKTRRAVLECQLNEFIKERNWLFVFLALGSYVARIIKDRATQTFRTGTQQKYKNSAMTQKWDHTLMEVAELNKSFHTESF